jgi:hypothetical protein
MSGADSITNQRGRGYRVTTSAQTRTALQTLFGDEYHQYVTESLSPQNERALQEKFEGLQSEVQKQITILNREYNALQAQLRRIQARITLAEDQLRLIAEDKRRVEQYQAITEYINTQKLTVSTSAWWSGNSDKRSEIVASVNRNLQCFARSEISLNDLITNLARRANEIIEDKSSTRQRIYKIISTILDMVGVREDKRQKVTILATYTSTSGKQRKDATEELTTTLIPLIQRRFPHQKDLLITHSSSSPDEEQIRCHFYEKSKHIQQQFKDRTAELTAARREENLYDETRATQIGGIAGALESINTGVHTHRQYAELILREGFPLPELNIKANEFVQLDTGTEPTRFDVRPAFRIFSAAIGPTNSTSPGLTTTAAKTDLERTRGVFQKTILSTLHKIFPKDEKLIFECLHAVQSYKVQKRFRSDTAKKRWTHASRDEQITRIENFLYGYFDCAAAEKADYLYRAHDFIQEMLREIDSQRGRFDRRGSLYKALAPFVHRFSPRPVEEVVVSPPTRQRQAVALEEEQPVPVEEDDILDAAALDADEEVTPHINAPPAPSANARKYVPATTKTKPDLNSLARLLKKKDKFSKHVAALFAGKGSIPTFTLLGKTNTDEIKAAIKQVQLHFNCILNGTHPALGATTGMERLQLQYTIIQYFHTSTLLMELRDSTLRGILISERRMATETYKAINADIYRFFASYNATIKSIVACADLAETRTAEHKAQTAYVELLGKERRLGKAPLTHPHEESVARIVGTPRPHSQITEDIDSFKSLEPTFGVLKFVFPEQSGSADPAHRINHIVALLIKYQADSTINQPDFIAKLYRELISNFTKTSNLPWHEYIFMRTIKETALNAYRYGKLKVADQTSLLATAIAHFWDAYSTALGKAAERKAEMERDAAPKTVTFKQLKDSELTGQQLTTRLPSNPGETDSQPYANNLTLTVAAFTQLSAQPKASKSQSRLITQLYHVLRHELIQIADLPHEAYPLERVMAEVLPAFKMLNMSQHSGQFADVIDYFWDRYLAQGDYKPFAQQCIASLVNDVTPFSEEMLLEQISYLLPILPQQPGFQEKLCTTMATESFWKAAIDKDISAFAYVIKWNFSSSRHVQDMSPLPQYMHPNDPNLLAELAVCLSQALDDIHIQMQAANNNYQAAFTALQELQKFASTFSYLRLSGSTDAVYFKQILSKNTKKAYTAYLEKLIELKEWKHLYKFKRTELFKQTEIFIRGKYEFDVSDFLLTSFKEHEPAAIIPIALIEFLEATKDVRKSSVVNEVKKALKKALKPRLERKTVTPSDHLEERAFAVIGKTDERNAIIAELQAAERAERAERLAQQEAAAKRARRLMIRETAKAIIELALQGALEKVVAKQQKTADEAERLRLAQEAATRRSPSPEAAVAADAIEEEEAEKVVAIEQAELKFAEDFSTEGFEAFPEEARYCLTYLDNVYALAALSASNPPRVQPRSSVGRDAHQQHISDYISHVTSKKSYIFKVLFPTKLMKAPFNFSEEDLAPTTTLIHNFLISSVVWQDLLTEISSEEAYKSLKRTYEIIEQFIQKLDKAEGSAFSSKHWFFPETLIRHLIAILHHDFNFSSSTGQLLARLINLNNTPKNHDTLQKIQADSVRRQLPPYSHVPAVSKPVGTASPQSVSSVSRASSPTSIGRKKRGLSVSSISSDGSRGRSPPARQLHTESLLSRQGAAGLGHNSSSPVGVFGGSTVAALTEKELVEEGLVKKSLVSIP